jgi:hypothetical protein
MKRLGLDDGADPDAMKAAFKAVLKQLDDQAAEYKKKFDDAGGDDTAMADGDDDKDKDKDKSKLDDAGDDTGALSDGDSPGTSNVQAQLRAMAKALGCTATVSSIADAVKVLKVNARSVDEVAQLRKQVSDLEARDSKRAAAEKTAQVHAFVKQAIEDGRFDPERADDLRALAGENFKLAEKALQKKNFWKVAQRMTAQGRPIGTALSDEHVDLEAGARGSSGLPELDAEGSRFAGELEAKAKADGRPISFSDALLMAARQKPHLFNRRVKIGA